MEAELADVSIDGIRQLEVPCRVGHRFLLRCGLADSSIMESVDRATRVLLPYLTHCSVRRMMPWALMSFMVIGSLVKELMPPAATYLSNKRNVLNM